MAESYSYDPQGIPHLLFHCNIHNARNKHLFKRGHCEHLFITPVRANVILTPILSPSSFQDHIQEVLGKWESIDDEIWAKVIVLERNRRVAKAYARAPVLTVNGSPDGFDGFR